MMVPLMRSMYGLHFVHVSATTCIEFLMRELRRRVGVSVSGVWVWASAVVGEVMARVVGGLEGGVSG